MANFLKARGAWDNKPTTVSSYVGADAAKPAEKKAKPKLDAKVLNSYVGKKMAEAAAVKVHQPGYNPPKQEHISSPEDAPDGEMTALILGGKKSLDKIKEAAAVKKPEPPFEPDVKPAKKVTAGKHGQGYSQARHLARKGMQQMLQINPKIAESWSDQTLDELNKSTLASYVKKATGGLEGAANQAYEAGRRGTEGGKNFATAVKRVKGVEKAVNKLAKEAVNYPGIGTDVVDKKKKLNPQPALTMKAKQVKDFKEEALDEGKMKDIYTDMIDHATKKGYASHKEFTPKDYETVGKLHGISGKELAVLAGHKTAAQVTKEEVQVDEGNRLSHALVQVGKSKWHIYDTKTKETHSTYNNKNVAMKKYLELNDKHAGYNSPGGLVQSKYGVRKEENLDELKARTLQSYADKAHQQAMDATYDAAHLNRTGEEKLKADAKRIAAKRAAGVQRAQTKLDRKYNAAGDAYLAHTGQKMSEEMTDQTPQEFAHGISDVVQCKRTHRLASVISAEDDKYTVVYADGSTETGPADYWSAIRPVTEGRVVEQPRGWNVKHLKPAGHGIIGKKVRSYDFPGMHDSHYIEGHVTDEDPQSYHIRTTKVVRHNKEEPIASHHMHIRAPKGISLFGGAQGVYYAPKEMKPAKPAAKKTLGSLRSKR